MASETNGYPLRRRLLGFVCLALLCGIFYEGLKPFHSPANEVAWVHGANALRFGEHGTIFSPDPFPPPDSGGAERSIEIWIQPGKIEDSNTLVAFYDPTSPRHVSIRQEESDLVVEIESSVAWQSAKTEQMFASDAFRDGRRAFWAVTFGQSGTAIYRDGALVGSSALRPTVNELRGRLIVSGSPIFDDSWSGVLGGLAIYDSALDRGQVARHYASWKKGPGPAIEPGDNNIGLYLLTEDRGSVIHNLAHSGNDLQIPPRYMVLRKTLLDPIWRAFRWDRGFWQDALINVGGFIPLGLFLCAYFFARGFSRPVLCATALGAAVSLIIEVTQKFLPSRDSSMADLINNTLGSIIGAAAYRGWVARMIGWGLSRIAKRFEQVNENRKPRTT